MNVGVGLHAYNSSRRRELVKFLSDLNVNVSSDRVVINIKKDIAENIIEKSKEHDDGVFGPSSLVNNEPTFFAIDNRLKD